VTESGVTWADVADVFVGWLGLCFGFCLWGWSVRQEEEIGEELDRFLPTTLVVGLLFINQYLGWIYWMYIGV
jgi:hypothetical protein